MSFTDIATNFGQDADRARTDARTLSSAIDQPIVLFKDGNNFYALPVGEAFVNGFDQEHEIINHRQ